eukprot:Partr_v1_DN28557_c3_g1_i3_m73483 putative Catalyzes the synthesis of dihydrouridine, a modified base found in the D-loop of most tRNAs (By similarity)
MMRLLLGHLHEVDRDRRFRAEGPHHLCRKGDDPHLLYQEEGGPHLLSREGEDRRQDHHLPFREDVEAHRQCRGEGHLRYHAVDRRLPHIAAEEGPHRLSREAEDRRRQSEEDRRNHRVKDMDALEADIDRPPLSQKSKYKNLVKMLSRALELPRGQVYANKVMLAPMVRIGLMPMRLSALDYGADLVYTDETVDLKIIGTRRVENKQLGTVDFMREDRVMFRTHPIEKDRLIFQIGSSDPDLALQAAMTVAKDVGAIDLNCGCPKHFSVHKGMGAALLHTPDLLVAILEKLVQNTGLPVTCKIRIYDDLDKTIALVQRLEKTGIQAIGVHCRTQHMKRTQRGDWSVFEHLVRAVSIPIIANGDVFQPEDIDRILQTGASSVMIARGAERNPSIFRRQLGLLPVMEAARKYMEYAIKYDNPYQNTKYVVASLRLRLPPDQAHRLTQAKTVSQLCVVLGFDDLVEEAEKIAALPLYDDMFPYQPTNEGLVEGPEVAEFQEEQAA